MRVCELLESPGLNIELHALNLPLFPSGAAAVGTVRLLRSLSVMWERGGGEGALGIASLEADGEMRRGLMERKKEFHSRSGGFNGVQKKKATISH